MLLKRIAKNNLRQKINVIFDRDEYDKLPNNLAAKKISKPLSKQELLKDLGFYVKYCLDNTANMDEEFERVLHSLSLTLKKKEHNQLKLFLNRLS